MYIRRFRTIQSHLYCLPHPHPSRSPSSAARSSRIMRIAKTRNRCHRSRKRRHNTKSSLIIRTARSIREHPLRTRPIPHRISPTPSRKKPRGKKLIKKKFYSLLIPTHRLQLTTLIRRNLLFRTTPLVEHIIQRNPNTNRIPHMRHQIRPLHAQTHGRVVDVVDEIMHVWRREVHESVHLRLAWIAGVLGERGRGTAEDEADVLVEVREEVMLV